MLDPSTTFPQYGPGQSGPMYGAPSTLRVRHSFTTQDQSVLYRQVFWHIVPARQASGPLYAQLSSEFSARRNKFGPKKCIMILLRR